MSVVAEISLTTYRTIAKITWIHENLHYIFTMRVSINHERMHWENNNFLSNDNNAEWHKPQLF